MQAARIKKDIDQLKKVVKPDKKQDLTIEEFWEEINNERIAGGKHPAIYIYRDMKSVMISEIFYEPNLEKIDEYRIQEGKFPLLPLYLAGEYKQVENELRKYEASFFRKIPRSTLLKEICQPLAGRWGFDDIDTYRGAERLFMQDQHLYHLHLKPELGREFAKYLIESWEKEGAVLEFDKEKQLFKRQPAKNKQIEREMIISEKTRKYIEPITDITGEFKFTNAVQDFDFFEFVDTNAVPDQLITL